MVLCNLDDKDFKPLNKIQNSARKIKERSAANDIVYTPEDLAINLIKLIPFEVEDFVLDPAAGKGAFANNFPKTLDIDSYDIVEGKDFFEEVRKVDWIVTNPPYSIMNDWLEHTCKIATKGFAYLVGSYSITPKRLQMIESYGFKLVHQHMFKVSRWFGMSVFVVFMKSEYNDHMVKYTYDRKVWK